MREHGYMQLGVVGEKLRIIQDGHDVTQNFMGLPVAVKVAAAGDFGETIGEVNRSAKNRGVVAVPVFAETLNAGGGIKNRTTDEQEPDAFDEQMIGEAKKPARGKKKVSNE